MTSDEKFMKEAIKEAKKAYDLKECPIGCVIVYNGKIIARGHNKKLTRNNALLHAEMIAIEKASKKLNTWHLDGCDMYVTLEPCTMCAGAIIQSRIQNVYFGAFDPKGGSLVSCNNLFDKKYGHNHIPNQKGGISENECSALLKSFFKELRAEKKKI